MKRTDRSVWPTLGSKLKGRSPNSLAILGRLSLDGAGGGAGDEVAGLSGALGAASVEWTRPDAARPETTRTTHAAKNSADTPLPFARIDASLELSRLGVGLKQSQEQIRITRSYSCLQFLSASKGECFVYEER